MCSHADLRFLTGVKKMSHDASLWRLSGFARNIQQQQQIREGKYFSFNKNKLNISKPNLYVAMVTACFISVL